MLWYTRQDLQCIEGPTVHTQGTREEMYYVLLTQKHRELAVYTCVSVISYKQGKISFLDG